MRLGCADSSFVNNDDPTAVTCMQRDDTCFICGKGVCGGDDDTPCTYVKNTFQCTHMAHVSCVEASTPCVPCLERCQARVPSDHGAPQTLFSGHASASRACSMVGEAT